MPQAEQEVLHADDTLYRVYSRPSGALAVLFVAYFKTQRTGQSPHSPKNCLPGSGWEPVETPGFIRIPVTGRRPLYRQPLRGVQGRRKDVVLYWYQSHGASSPASFPPSSGWWRTRSVTAAATRRW